MHHRAATRAATPLHSLGRRRIGSDRAAAGQPRIWTDSDRLDPGRARLLIRGSVVPVACPIEGSDRSAHGHSRGQRRRRDLHQCSSGEVESQPSKLVMRVRFPSPALNTFARLSLLLALLRVVSD